MTEAVKCPFCKKPLETTLVADFWLCKDCEAVVRREDDMPMKNANIYDIEWVRAQEKKKYIRNRLHYLSVEIKKIDGVKDILDVGCGTGILVDILSRSGYAVTGIDSSPEEIEFAKKNKKGNFIPTSVESFYDGKKYDLIVAAQLIEHIRKPEDFLAKAEALLKRGGYLVVETPNLNSWKERSLWRRRIGGMSGPDHRICYTPRSLARLLCDNGFSIHKLITKTYSPTIFIELVMTLYQFFKRKRTELIYSNHANASVFRGPTTKGTYKKIYEWIENCLILNVLLFVPNRISEIDGRGNQIIAIARKREHAREEV